MTHTVTMTTEAPQRLRALERANDIRLARAKLKRRIARGEVSVAQVILDSPQEAESWSVSELLMAQRRWGNERCRKFLKRNGIYELKPVGTLTDRQKVLLATELGMAPTQLATRPTQPETAPPQLETRSPQLEPCPEQFEMAPARELELAGVA